MERSKQETLQQLKDQMNTFRSVNKDPIDLANYKAYQFKRTSKNYIPTTPSSRLNRIVFKGKLVNNVKGRSSVATASDQYNVRHDLHKMSCMKGELGYTNEAPLNTDRQQKSYERFSQTTHPRRMRRGGSMANIHEANTQGELYPTDIGHLEKYVKFTSPNHRNMGGGRTCKREACINNNALLNPKFQNLLEKNKSAKELLDEENLMHQLQVFYKRNTDFNFDIVTKSALESNMFSNKRVTIEGMMKNQSDPHRRVSSLNKKELEVINLLKDTEKQNLRKNDLGEPTNRKEVDLLNQ